MLKNKLEFLLKKKILYFKVTDLLNNSRKNQNIYHNFIKNNPSRNFNQNSNFNRNSNQNLNFNENFNQNSNFKILYPRSKL